MTGMSSISAVPQGGPNSSVWELGLVRTSWTSRDADPIRWDHLVVGAGGMGSSVAYRRPLAPRLRRD